MKCQTLGPVADPTQDGHDTSRQGSPSQLQADSENLGMKCQTSRESRLDRAQLSDTLPGDKLGSTILESAGIQCHILLAEEKCACMGGSIDIQLFNAIGRLY